MDYYMLDEMVSKCKAENKIWQDSGKLSSLVHAFQPICLMSFSKE